MDYSRANGYKVNTDVEKEVNDDFTVYLRSFGSNVEESKVCLAKRSLPYGLLGGVKSPLSLMGGQAAINN